MAGLASGRVRAALLAVGAAGLALIVWQAGPAAVAARLAAIGPRWPLVLVPSIAVALLDTLAWRYAFTPGTGVGFWMLFRARLAGEAVNALTPTAYVGGEPVKAYCLARAVPLREGLSSVIVGKTLMSVAQLAFVALGVAVALGRFEGPRDLLAASGAALAAVGLALWWVVGRQHRGLVGWLVGLAARAGIRPRWLAARSHAIAEVDARIGRLYREERLRLHASTGLFFLGWLAGTAETYVAIRLMGLPVDLPTAFCIEALTGLAKGVTFVIPGSLGGQEAANAVLFAGFGYPLAASVGYSVIRRMREMLWAGAGLIVLARAGHPERHPPAGAI